MSGLQIQMNIKKHRSPAQQKRRLQPVKLWESQPDCKRTKWKKEKRTSIIEGRCWHNDNVKERNDADGGIDQLLMLAQSAELLSTLEADIVSSKRKNHNHEEVTQTATQLQNTHSNSNSTDEQLVEHHLATRVKSNVEAGEIILPLQRKTGLSAFRGQAHSRIARLVQGMHENGTHGCMGRRSKDAQNMEMLHAKQAMSLQYVKEPTNCYLQMSEGMYSHGAEDQFVSQQPSATQVKVSAEVQMSGFEKIQIRLTELKRQARQRHSHLVEKTFENQLDHQNGEGT